MIARSSRQAVLTVGRHAVLTAGALAAFATLGAGALAVQRGGAEITIGTSRLSWGACPAPDAKVGAGHPHECRTVDVPTGHNRRGRKILISISRRAEPSSDRSHTLWSKLDVPDRDRHDLLDLVARLLPGHVSDATERR